MRGENDVDVPQAEDDDKAHERGCWDVGDVIIARASFCSYIYTRALGEGVTL